jgi:hypothetical protein
MVERGPYKAVTKVRFLQEPPGGKGMNKNNETPFIYGDRQQNTYALAERMTDFFISKSTGRHVKERERLMRELNEYAIKHFLPIFLKEAVMCLLVNYISNMEDNKIHESYLMFEDYKKGKRNESLEISDKFLWDFLP